MVRSIETRVFQGIDANENYREELFDQFQKIFSKSIDRESSSFYPYKASHNRAHHSGFPPTHQVGASSENQPRGDQNEAVLWLNMHYVAAPLGGGRLFQK